MTKSRDYLNKSAIPGEVRLWSECIIQHFRDLFLIQRKGYNHKLSAKQFLFQRCYGFDIICNLIGNDPALLSKKIRTLYRATRQQKISIAQSSDLLYEVITETYISSLLFNKDAS